MKTLYYFKPNGQWNLTTESAYNYLLKFYGPWFLRKEEVQE